MDVMALKYKGKLIGYRMIDDTGLCSDVAVSDVSHAYLTPYSLEVELCSDGVARTEDEIISMLNTSPEMLDSKIERYSKVLGHIQSRLKGFRQVASRIDHEKGVICLRCDSSSSFQEICSDIGTDVIDDFLVYPTKLNEGQYKLYIAVKE